MIQQFSGENKWLNYLNKNELGGSTLFKKYYLLTILIFILKMSVSILRIIYHNNNTITS